MKKMSPVSVIIPAAGESRRFLKSKGASRATMNKLYAALGARPLIAHTLACFDALSEVQEIIVALPRGQEKYFRREILSSQKFRKPVFLVQGGATRAESVLNALKRVSKKSNYVCIHDGARPLVQASWLQMLLKNLNGCDGVVLGRPSVSTVKEYDPESGEIKRTLARHELFEAETPQLFKKEVLLQSYRILGARAFSATDDASLVEAIGGRVKAFAQTDPNIKVTTYQDLAIAENLAQCGRSQTLRFGSGFDRHRLVAKRPFFLGGVRIPSRVGPLGHSDGDPLLHAITDGILGAIGAGDIGDFFPDTSRRWKNANSSVFLKKAILLAREKGMQPAQLDATIFLERPKLSMHKKKIKMKLAQLLSLLPADVNVKAKTAEGLGAEGAGLAVSCQALVVLKSIHS